MYDIEGNWPLSVCAVRLRDLYLVFSLLFYLRYHKLKSQLAAAKSPIDCVGTGTTSTGLSIEDSNTLSCLFQFVLKIHFNLLRNAWIGIL